MKAVILILACVVLLATLLVQRAEAQHPLPLFPISVNDRWGYIDKTGKIVIQPRFDHAEIFSEGLAEVSIDGRSGYIDATGTIVIPLQFRRGGPFSEGLAAVEVDRKWGYVGRTGELVIAATFYAAGRFSYGLAPVAVRYGESGYINKRGAFVTPPTFRVPFGFSEGLAAVLPGGDPPRWSYIDTTGKTTIHSRPAMCMLCVFQRGWQASAFLTGIATATRRRSTATLTRRGRLSSARNSIQLMPFLRDWLL